MGYERSNIDRMAGYVYGEQPDDPTVVKLNTNENPYPPSPAVRRALRRFDADTLRRYPPATAEPLRHLVAERLSVLPEQVVVTNGGDEALRLAITTFVDPGATFGTTDPGYSLCPVLAGVQGCEVEAVPMTADWSLPGDFARRLNARGAKLACIVNPHAPSGALVEAGTIAAIAAELDGVLLVDEAYVDFVDPEVGHDLTPLVADHDNVLLLRTLSKGYSLAGLRVGFLVGDARLIDPVLTKTRDSYNVDTIAQELGAAAYADLEHARETWQAVLRERRRLVDELRARPFRVAESQANFVLAEATGDHSAKAVFDGLRKRGIVVRHFDTHRLAQGLRITVGTPVENDALIAALDDIFRQACVHDPSPTRPL